MSIRKGFSLIELLVVIAIVGLLAAIAVPSYNTYVTRTKAMKVIAAMESFKKQVVQYYNVNNRFPSATEIAPSSVNNWIIGPANYPDLITELGLNFMWYGASSNFFQFHAYVNTSWPSDAYVNPTAIIAYRGTVDSNGIFTFSCGSFNGAGFNLRYLPTNCQTLW